MVGLVSILAGEILYESIKFVIMLGLLVAAVFIGGALRKKKDAKKARRCQVHPGHAFQQSGEPRVKKDIFGFL